LADHAAHGKAAPVGLLDSQVIEHGEHVTAETFHGIGALRTTGPAVAAPVIAHEPKVLRERRDLRVPHLQRGAERIRQHQRGRSFRTLDFDMDGTAVGIDHRHDFPSGHQCGGFGVPIIVAATSDRNFKSKTALE
jgi:hypothetical protein